MRAWADEPVTDEHIAAVYELLRWGPPALNVSPLRQLGSLAPHMADAEERFGSDATGRERVTRDNAWLQAGYLVVALRASGLDVGPMGGMDVAAVDAELFAGTGCRSLLVMNVGWPAWDPGAHPRAPRLGFDQVARTL